MMGSIVVICMMGCQGRLLRDSIPDENRFTKVVLAEGLNEPMVLVPLKDGRVLFAERKGDILMHHPDKEGVRVIGNISVSTKYINQEGVEREGEDGILGMIADPKFEENGWIYIYYSPKSNDPKNIIARYEMRGDEILQNSKKVLLEIPTQRQECCHAGGGMVFDNAGNLHVATGDNTNPFSFVSGFAPLDERPGREPWDAQRTSANSNDLRGKIIRINPEIDGTYSIPEGNLFPVGTPKARPEIYGMGVRNPWRLSVDSKTDFLYWGEVGSDMKDSVGLGPNGVDEFNQARSAGNFGWPYIVGNNKAFWGRDFSTGLMGDQFDPERLVNNSVNNTGLTDLPIAQKSLIWYSYIASEEFPNMGSGGRSAVGGPIFRRDDFSKDAKRLFPSYYEGKWFITDFMRGWIKVVTFDNQHNYKSIEDFLPNIRFDSPIDMKFGAEGDLYVLEYGSAWFRGNDNARLIRIEYNGGNRSPVLEATADKVAGKAPLNIHFDASASIDPDEDKLVFEWSVMTEDGKPLARYGGSETNILFDKEGVYQVNLVVTDDLGASSGKKFEIKVGNEAPEVHLEITKGNRTFFFPDIPFEYDIYVSDLEDGDTRNMTIDANEVAFTIDYMPESYDRVDVEMQHRLMEGKVGLNRAWNSILASDCQSCHTIDMPSAGPSYQLISQKYKDDPKALDFLSQKVIDGGSGNWGEVAMSAHPQLTISEAKEMVSYILSLSDGVDNQSVMPLKGRYVPDLERSAGYYLLRASYKDRGAKGVSSIIADRIHVLRSAEVAPETSDFHDGTELIRAQGSRYLLNGPMSFVGYKDIDLTGITEIWFYAQVPTRMNADGASIEVRLDNPNGELISEKFVIKNGAELSRRDPIRIKIRPSDSERDVYFVFNGPKTDLPQTFLQLSSIHFKN